MRLHYNNVITYCGVSIVQECRNATHDGFEPYIVSRVSLEIQGALRTGHPEEPGHGYSRGKMSVLDSSTYAAEIVKPTSKGPIVSVTTELAVFFASKVLSPSKLSEYNNSSEKEVILLRRLGY